jgi:hypothetical protein
VRWIPKAIDAITNVVNCKLRVNFEYLFGEICGLYTVLLVHGVAAD